MKNALFIPQNKIIDSCILELQFCTLILIKNKSKVDHSYVFFKKIQISNSKS